MNRWIPLASLAVVGVMLFWTVPLWPRLAAQLPPCPFRTVTGVPCPTCGTGRALVAASQGRWREALQHNPLMVVALLLAGVSASLWVCLSALARPFPRVLASLDKEWPWWLRASVVTALAANWVWVLLHR